MLTDDCISNEGSVCAWVYDRAGNASFARLADWFIDRPIRVVVILVVALVLTRIARNWVRRLVSSIMTPDTSPAEKLGRLGIDVPKSLETPIRDPRRDARAASVSVMLTSTLVVSIWVIAGMMVLSTVGIDLAPLLAGAGIAGIALGFGAQSLVKDCIAGLFMLLEDQYGIGDVIDLGEARGTVEQLSLRTTVLRSADGTVWHVPNGVVQRVGNLSQLWSVAVLDVDVAYDSDVAVATDLLRQAADDVCSSEEHADQIIEPPQVLGVEALAADGVTLRLTVKVKPGTQWALQRALRQHIKTVFDQAAIEIPFPQRTVWMRVESDTSTPVEEPPE
jgi:small conductance mechanosensitive channel